MLEGMLTLRRAEPHHVNDCNGASRVVLGRLVHGDASPLNCLPPPTNQWARPPCTVLRIAKPSRSRRFEAFGKSNTNTHTSVPVIAFATQHDEERGADLNRPITVLAQLCPSSCKTPTSVTRSSCCWSTQGITAPGNCSQFALRSGRNCTVCIRLHYEVRKRNANHAL